jgi:hypothetical protein
MSFLAPLYILGALTILAPVVFHLIRRTTRGEQPFSSLLFLSPSPPRLTRRSRLDQWLLLLLRAAALGLLALAFARPFLRQPIGLPLDDAIQRRVVVLIDTSASMRRGDLWRDAQARARETIAACRPSDALAIFAFDATTRPVLTFESSAALDPSRRQAVATQLIDRLQPTWAATHLGQSLIDVAGLIEDVGDDNQGSSPIAKRIVLISDLQRGARIERLGDSEWPKEVELELRPIAAKRSNAGLQEAEAADEATETEPNTIRVRIANDTHPGPDTFRLTWEGSPIRPEPVYVPAGESRVVKLSRPEGSGPGLTLRLEGDGEPFDNQLFLASTVKESAAVLYLGPDRADDPAGLAYYLERAFQGLPARRVQFETADPTAPRPSDPAPDLRLAVVAGETTPANGSALRRWAESGGTVLVVALASGNSPTLATLADAPGITYGSPLADGDTILGAIAFDHPLFAAFAAPQFNDFTRIKFWKRRLLPTDKLGEVRVLARFEGGEPALVEKPLGKGRLLILASGWSPADSQLARSSKFMPLMATLLDRPGESAESRPSRLVGQPLAVPEGSASITTPSKVRTTLDPATSGFSATDEPGLYTIESTGGPRPVAVNLDPLESRTDPLEAELFEQYGCRMARSDVQKEADREATRQLRNAELEGRQKLWRPLILALIALLIAETLLAGRHLRARPQPDPRPEVTPS